MQLYMHRKQTVHQKRFQKQTIKAVVKVRIETRFVYINFGVKGGVQNTTVI